MNTSANNTIKNKIGFNVFYLLSKRTYPMLNSFQCFIIITGELENCSIIKVNVAFPRTACFSFSFLCDDRSFKRWQLLTSWYAKCARLQIRSLLTHPYRYPRYFHSVFYSDWIFGKLLDKIYEALSCYIESIQRPPTANYQPKKYTVVNISKGSWLPSSTLQHNRSIEVTFEENYYNALKIDYCGLN